MRAVSARGVQTCDGPNADKKLQRASQCVPRKHFFLDNAVDTRSVRNGKGIALGTCHLEQSKLEAAHTCIEIFVLGSSKFAYFLLLRLSGNTVTAPDA